MGSKTALCGTATGALSQRREGQPATAIKSLTTLPHMGRSMRRSCRQAGCRPARSLPPQLSPLPPPSWPHARCTARAPKQAPTMTAPAQARSWQPRQWRPAAPRGRWRVCAATTAAAGRPRARRLLTSSCSRIRRHDGLSWTTPWKRSAISSCRAPPTCSTGQSTSRLNPSYLRTHRSACACTVACTRQRCSCTTTSRRLSGSTQQRRRTRRWRSRATRLVGLLRRCSRCCWCTVAL
mmetsp:Transcript_5843/g.17870  ORF Transcript_5843/g.17870 Transcript_5843/m.17870 type:complete len:237 (+) Transcript_5843:1234-1944(+)